jgi:hypothetical protein
MVGRKGVFMLGLCALLSGCTTSNPADGGTAAEACPLVHPDGSPAPCDESRWSNVTVLNPAPSISSTWMCKDDSEASNGNRQQIWMNSQGHVGIRWDWSAVPLGGQGAVLAAFYQEGQDQFLLVPFQKVGFVAFPKAPLNAPMEIHLVAYNFSILRNEVDPFAPEHWYRVEDAKLLASTFGAQPWFNLAVNGTKGPEYILATGADLTEAGKPMYRPKSKTVLAGEGETSYTVQLYGGGAKWPNRDPTRMRADPGFCYLEDRPVGTHFDAPLVADAWASALATAR